MQTTNLRFKFRLTTFEIAFNAGLILSFLAVFYTGNDSANGILTISLISFFLPGDLSPKYTIYSKKIENFLIQGTIVFLIYINQDKFFSNSGFAATEIIFPFCYFNLMRFFGELYIGKDPIWLPRTASVGYYSESKKRKTKKTDVHWTTIYYIGFIIIAIFYVNRKWFF